MTSPSEPTVDERAAKDNILRLQKDLIRALSELSYVSGDVVILVPRDDTYGNPVSISMSYVTRSDAELEVAITEELVKRMTATIHEWNDWVAKQLAAQENEPF